MIFNLKKSRKFIFLTLLCAFLCLSMSSCYDPYSVRATRMTAYDFPESMWQSDKPFIYLRVNENQEEIDGYILLDSQLIDIECAIDWGKTFVIYKKTEHNRVEVSDYVLEGNCICKEEKIVLMVKRDYCFDNQYDEIVLYRKQSGTEDR